MKKLAIAVMVILMFAVQVRAEDCSTVREAFGAAMGLNVYNAQMVAGLTADAYGKKVYTAKEVQTICTEQKNGLTVLSAYCIKLEPLVNAKELETLKEMEATITKLQATLDALNKYTIAPSSANVNYFEAKRKASWEAVAKLLGMNP